MDASYHIPRQESVTLGYLQSRNNTIVASSPIEATSTTIGIQNGIKHPTLTKSSDIKSKGIRIPLWLLLVCKFPV